MAATRAAVKGGNATQKKRKTFRDVDAHTRDRVAAGRITRSMAAVASNVFSATPSIASNISKPASGKSRPKARTTAHKHSVTASATTNLSSVDKPAVTNSSATNPSSLEPAATNTTATNPENHQTYIRNEEIITTVEDPTHATLISHQSQNDSIQTAPTVDVSQAHFHVTDSMLALLPHIDPSNVNAQAVFVPTSPNRYASHAFIQATFGYIFKDVNLINEALDATRLYQPDSNKSLAMIGDSVLQTNIIREWYPTFQSRDKCVGSGLISSIGSNANLARCGRRIGLDERVVVPSGMRYTGPTDYMLATAMEAVLGAIDVDLGEDADSLRIRNRKCMIRWQSEKSLEDMDTKE